MLILDVLRDRFEINKIKNEKTIKQEAETNIRMYFNFKCGDCYLQAEELIDERPEDYVGTCRKCFYETKSKYSL